MYNERLLENDEGFKIGTGICLSEISYEEISPDTLNKGKMKDATLANLDKLKLIQVRGSTYDYQDRETNEIYIGTRSANIKAEGIFSYNDLTTRTQTESAIKYCRIIGKEFLAFRSMGAGAKELKIYTKDGELLFLPSKLDNHNKKLIKAKNMKILSLIQYGEVKELKDFTCIYANNKLEKYDRWLNRFKYKFEIHHVKVVNRSSQNKAKNKEGKPIAPSAQMDTNIDNSFIEELMGCVVLSPDYHDFIHDGKPHTDYRAFHKRELSFVYRSEENYNFVVQELNINTISYNDFLLKEKNDKMPTSFITKDWL